MIEVKVRRVLPVRRLVKVALLLAGLGAAGGCAATGAPATEQVAAVTKPAASLHDRLGGKPAIEAVVDDFLGRVLRDSRINARFSNVDPARLRMMLVDQICEAAGGPCRYLGRDMRTAHAGLMITELEWNALIEDLQATLAHFKVPAREQGELMAALGPMKPDVVGLDASAVTRAGGGGASVAGAGGAGRAANSTLAPVAERAQGLREAAALLEKAAEAHRRGNRSLAEQLFSSAEIITGPEPVAQLAALFRDGAPPRVTAPALAVPLDAPAQPRAVGSSEEEEEATPAPARPRATVTGGLRFSGAPPGDQLAVITLEPLDGKVKARRRPPRQRVIEQRNREFAPRVLAVPVGSTVSFPNFDSIFHNVFSRSETQPFDLGLYKAGVSREIKLEREGIVRVGCNLHANMRAYVVAVSAPHYVITAPDGTFTFRRVEPGRYRLRAYHERSDQPLTQELMVAKGANSVTLTFAGAMSADGPLADKFGNSRGPRPQPR